MAKECSLRRRGRLRGGRIRLLRRGDRRPSRPVRRQRDRRRGRQDRREVPGEEARDDRPDALGARDQEDRRLGLLLGAAEAPPGPQDAGPAGQGRRRLELDQRHGLRPRQPGQLRRLGRRGQHRLGRRQRQRGVQAHGGLRGRRGRLPRRRRPDQGHDQQEAAGGVAPVPPGHRRRHRLQDPRRLQRRVAGGRRPDAAERRRRPALQRLARLHPQPRAQDPAAAVRDADPQGRSSRTAGRSASRSRTSARRAPARRAPSGPARRSSSRPASSAPRRS